MLLKSWIFSAVLSVRIIIGLMIAWILEHPNAEMVSFFILFGDRYGDCYGERYGDRLDS
jgi:predicted Co/Zn/Cd cation transporter (cation efflux family)